jgi:hypothetical protein
VRDGGVSVCGGLLSIAKEEVYTEEEEERGDGI